MTPRLSIVLVSLAVLSGCLRDEPCRDMNFGRLSSTDRIVLSDNNKREIDSILDKGRIGGIVTFALSHEEGWKVGAVGTPVALLRANFYEDGKFIGDLGIGSDFVAAQGCGYFAFREISSIDRARLMKLFAVADPYGTQ